MSDINVNVSSEASDNENDNANSNANANDKELLPEKFEEEENEDLENKTYTTFYERYFSPLQYGSLRGSIISLASMCFGPASLSFPVAFTNIGLVPGIILLTVLTAVSYWSLANLIETAKKKKIFNYSKLIQECLGDKMLLISDINNMLFCFGVLMAYQFTISQFFFGIAQPFFSIDRDDKITRLVQMTACMLLFQLPLCLLKNISKLQYASILATVALLYTIVVIAVQSPFYYIEGIEAGRSLKLFKELDWSLLDSFSIFLYGYASHNGILAIYSELRNPTLRRGKKVLNRAMVLQITLFSVISLCGYFSLIKDMPSIFISRPALSSLEGKDYYMLVAKVLFFFGLPCTFALTFNILKGSIQSFFFKTKENTFLCDFAIAFSILLASNMLTFFVDNVVKIVGILGGLCAVIVCYVSPVLCYVKTNEYGKTHWKNISSIGILIVICIVGLISTAKTIFDNFKG